MKTKILVLFAMLVALSLQVYAKPKGHLEGAININQASATELMLLPGVGKKRAADIASYRQNAPFKSVEELNNVPGIGDKALATLRPFVTINGPTTAKWVKE